jgi:hypothetical protein
MADQKDMRAISRIAVADELGRNKIVHKAFEGRKQFCEFGFHEFAAPSALVLKSGHRVRFSQHRAAGTGQQIFRFRLRPR